MEKILFELSHKDRVRILKHLEKGPSRLTQISNSLKINNVEASRHLSRLSDVDMVTKTTENEYALTNMSHLIMMLYHRMQFVVDNREFFISHDITAYPMIVDNIDALSKAEMLTGFFEVVSLIKDVSVEAEEYLYVFSPSPMKDVAPINVEKAKKGVEVRIIYGTGSAIPPEYEGTEIKVRFNDNLKCAMKMNEKRGGMAFPLNDGTMDFTTVCTGGDGQLLSYLKNNFEKHWKESKP
ncbi:MAG TPA: ArsR family transcriptional regulator [Euryarchaeota archaeon]|nr:ArsR family transcriptional regulator [Euryarchaeota archaeon]